MICRQATHPERQVGPTWSRNTNLSHEGVHPPQVFQSTVGRACDAEHRTMLTLTPAVRTTGPQLWLTPGRSRREKIGEKGSKWLVNLLYSRPPAFQNRYMGQPSRLWTASQPAANQRYLSRELMSELSVVGTNTCARIQILVGGSMAQMSVECWLRAA